MVKKGNECPSPQLSEFVMELGKIVPSGAIYNGVQVYYTVDKTKGLVGLDVLQEQEHGKGKGNEVLKEITGLSDKFCVPLRVYAHPLNSGDDDAEQLMAWYEKHGFVFDKTPGKTYGLGFRYPVESKIKIIGETRKK